MIEGHIYTEGRITKDYPQQIKAQIAALATEYPGYEKVIHHIQSPGGDCYAAFNGYHEIMKIGKPIKSIIEGEAQSMATFLAIAPAAEVEILNPSTFMIHEPFFPEGVAGTVDELQAAQTELEQIRSAMADAYAKKTGKPIPEILAMMKKTTRLDASMAVAMGFCNKLIEPSRVMGISEIVKEIKQLKTDFMGLFNKRAVANAPSAIDLPLKDGKMMNVQSDNGDLVGKPATVDSQPAEGNYLLNDGRTITCVGGIVTAVSDSALPAPAPEESEAAKLQKQLAALQSQMATIKAAEDAKIKAEEEAKKVAAEKAAQEAQVKALEDANKAVAELAAKVKELENKPLGSQEKPAEAMNTNPMAFGIGNTQADKQMMYATRSVIAEHTPWLEQTEVFRKKYPNGKYPDGTKFTDYRPGGPNAVSVLETNLNYTWNGILSTDLFFKPTLSTPAIADVFTVDLGASDTKRYHIAPVMNKILKPYTGCGQAVTGSSYDITSKKMQLKPFEMYEAWCKDDFTDQLSGSYNLLAQEWLKTGTDSFDPAGTPIDRMIIKLLKDGLRRDIWRRISFGDTTSSSADWNQIDGLWQSLIDQSGASNYCVYASKTNFGTGTLAASAAYNELVAQFKGSSNLLKEYAIDGGRGQFLVTRSVWDNLYDSYTGTGAVTELAFQAAQSGYGKLTFRGIPVVPITIWDDFLADSTNPLSATTRHLIAFTVKDNHILGVENTADLDKIDSWFEKKDNKRYYRSNMTMGFLGAVHCDLTTISY